jgi:superfamily II helicase
MKRQKCPAPKLSSKLPNLVMSIGMFYKREIGLEDIRAINPNSFKQPYVYRNVIKRLEALSYVRTDGDRFQVTEYGAQSMAAYESWKRSNNQER